MATLRELRPADVCDPTWIRNALKPIALSISKLRLPSAAKRRADGESLVLAIKKRHPETPIYLLEDEENLIKYPADYQEFGLCVAALMVADKMIRTTGHAISKRSGKPAKLWRRGPMLRGQVTWCEGVIAAANYVRHVEDWRQYLRAIKVTSDDGRILSQLHGPSVAKKALEAFTSENSGFAKSAEVLLQLGYDEYLIFYHHEDILPGLVEDLGLSRNAKFVRHFEDWLRASCRSCN